MEQHGQHSEDPERRTTDDPSSDRRQSRRLSLLKVKDMVGAAIGAVAKIAEPRKEIDPEDEPDFTERHPLWEDDLPPIYAHEDHVPDLLALEGAGSEVPIAPKTPLPRVEEPHLSESALRARERWKQAYATIKRNLALRNQSLRSSVGTGGELEGLAFGVWGRYSPSRIYLFQSVYNTKTEYIIFVLIIVHVIIMILKASKKGSMQGAHITMEQLNILDATLTTIFSYREASYV
ncbi:hypothetical protein L7F22_047895 [Adiantum nelumboides]|nr:hypothetical protein [Adiantum nelumboides]